MEIYKIMAEIIEKAGSSREEGDGKKYKRQREDRNTGRKKVETEVDRVLQRRQ